MHSVREAIQTTPIIDHHAHNLLIPSDIGNHEFLSITSEASGPALKHATSTLSHLRAVKQLAFVLGCEPTWDKVQEAIELKRKEPSDAWARRCFEGIETAIIDDGLDPSSVHSYEWHDRLTRSPCKRIVRIERVAESTVKSVMKSFRETPSGVGFPQETVARFCAAISDAIADPEVVGFKSVICYRVGLAIPKFDENDGDTLLSIFRNETHETFNRLEEERLSPYFVHLTARLIAASKSKKPFQFHTGLGDNDINLGLSNPSHLQPFIEMYAEVPIVLLHAAYPFTAEAGYLASVYGNVFLDIGEVFPFVSQDGQERVIRNALNLCPSEKLTWSTDGHWFPETYLLAVVQFREGMNQVLNEYVSRDAVTVVEAVKIVQDIFFNTSNRLYKLDLRLTPLTSISSNNRLSKALPKTCWETNFLRFQHFLNKNPSIKYLRLQWLDYTSTLRLRLLPINRALKMFQEKKFISVTKAVLGLLQEDASSVGFSATGEYNLYPCFEGLRCASRPGHATVQCEFQEKDGQEVSACPRTLLRNQVEKADSYDLSFLVGFEVEVVFMRREILNGGFQYGGRPMNEGGHAWSATRALQDDNLMDMMETIFHNFQRSGIELQQFHPESCPGQYEFVLSPLPPLEAVDTLLAAREIISLAAANANMRATLIPKPFPNTGGTGAHVHLSMTPPDQWESFYAGVLKHLRAIAAITYSNAASYARAVDSVWAGGTWVAWGTQNRETPLRRIEGSHFEIKCMDGLSNPYLALAAIIGCGMHGMVNAEPLIIKECLEDPSTLSGEKRHALGIDHQLPKGMKEAMECLRDDTELRSILGDRATTTYLAVKEAEIEMLDAMDAEKRRTWLIERY